MSLTRGFSKTPELVRWDYYAGSLVDPIESDLVVSGLAASLNAVPRMGVPRNGYQRCVELRRGDAAIAQVMSGGNHATSYVQASGASSGSVASVLRANWVHRVSRVDACVDYDVSGAWDSVCRQALAVARLRGISKQQAGDWLDPHERLGDGRTLYLGGKSSAVRVRVYEKGRQLPEAGRPDWVRAEVQVRPAKAAKRMVAGLEPREVWGTSAWSADLLERLSGEDVPAARVVTYMEPDGQRSYMALLRQYGRTLDRLAEMYGGDWCRVGMVLGDDLSELRATGVL